MKKYLAVSAIVLCLGLMVYKAKAGAGNQYNWGTQNGSSWVTPDDSRTTAGQVLQIGASGGATVVAAATPLTILSGSSVTINALTPATTGQLVFMLAGGLQNNVLCISTGSTSSSQWALVSSTTTACK